MKPQFCSSCGFRFHDGDRFCRGCGDALTEDARAVGPIAEAEVLAGKGQLDEAIATVQRALGEGERPDLHVAMSTLYLRRTDVVLARRELDRAIDLDPGYAVAYAYKGGVLLQIGEVDEARGLLDRAKTLAPRDLLVSIKRAEFWLRLGALPNARDELRAGLANGGGSPAARDTAQAMLGSVEHKLRTSAQRAIVPLPSLGPIRRLFRRQDRQRGVEVER
jgi:tetratricopeptide (TPR) repeat protein